MTEYYAKDYGILPNIDVSKGLVRLFRDMQNNDENKTIIFESGTYYISSKNCEMHTLYVTNTVGNNEYSKDEVRHKVPVAFYLNNVKNLVIDGCDSTFIINGRCTNMALEDCENIVVKNLEITHAHPHLHELKVVSKSAFAVDFVADKESNILAENNKIYFTGEDYKLPVNANATMSWWNGYINVNTPDKVVRHRHPFAQAIKLKYLGENRIRANYFLTSSFNIGDRFYIYHARRDYVGIFVNRCKNFELKNVKQRVSYSLALVCQDSENILVDNIEFAPKNSDEFKMASVADFIQICMCRGDVIIKDSHFDGAGDDLLNVHGVHFVITKRQENKLTVAFKHPQTHCYNPLRVGDTVAYIDKHSLLQKGTSKIVSSELINEDEIEICLDTIGDFAIGDSIENISACPNLLFKNNTSTRIITRGLLITTRGKVVVENNDFKSTSMSGILLSDDAKSWYESGMCKDVTIRNNTFHYCGETPILIKPENTKHEGAVHQNINIIGNKFEKYDGKCIKIKSSSDIKIEGNTFADENYVSSSNCENVVVKDNKVEA